MLFAIDVWSFSLKKKKINVFIKEIFLSIDWDILLFYICITRYKK